MPIVILVKSTKMVFRCKNCKPNIFFPFRQRVKKCLLLLGRKEHSLVSIISNKIKDHHTPPPTIHYTPPLEERGKLCCVHIYSTIFKVAPTPPGGHRNSLNLMCETFDPHCNVCLQSDVWKEVTNRKLLDVEQEHSLLQ